jgi:hypothetical protein
MGKIIRYASGPNMFGPFFLRESYGNRLFLNTRYRFTYEKIITFIHFDTRAIHGSFTAGNPFIQQ